MVFPTLFSPIRIGSMVLSNRLVLSPITTTYATDELLPSERLITFLEERALGGVGLITLEACTIDRRHREVPRCMHFSSDDVIPAHRALTDRIHACGPVKVAPQLAHPGPDGLAPFLENTPSVGPSVIPSYLTGAPSRELASEEIAEIVAMYGRAAQRVRAAGYDGLELHAAHGYMLLGSFLSPIRNRRTDAYTGTTDEGRTRLIVEVLQEIKREAGSDFPITLRISGYERAAGGRSIHDTPRIAPALARAGVDCFHVSGGVIDRLTSQIVTGASYRDGHNVGAAAAVKRVVDVPVMTVGRIHDPQLAEDILARGDADLIAMARPLLADPELPNKARTGRAREIRRCISCQTCIDSMQSGSMACAVNARSGREGRFPTTPARTPRRVVVIGGGTAGLEAARVAATRGHRVTLVERERRLGGSLLFAAAVHEANEPLLAFLLDQVRRLGVEVRTGLVATVEGVAGSRPEVVIVATGGRVVTPQIPGYDRPHVLTGPLLRRLLAGDVSGAEGRRLPRWQRLGGRALRTPLQRFVTPATIRGLSRRWMPLGRQVAIVGGDLAAVELAEFLAERGRRVALLSHAGEIAPEVGLKRRTEHMDRLDRLGVSVNTGIRVREIAAEDLVLEGSNGSDHRLAADSVVLAGEVRPETGLFEALEGAVPEVHAIGDCTGLGLIHKAVADAVRVASAI